MRTTDLPISLDYTFKCTVHDLWSALTDLDEMHSWYFEQIPTFELEIGHELEFEVKSENRTFTHQWKMVEIIPYSVISYRWRYKEYEGDSIVRFTVNKHKSGSALKLEVAVLEDFTSGIPEFQRESCIGGWQYFLEGNLRRHLEG